MKRIGKQHYSKRTAMGQSRVWGKWVSASFSPHQWLCDVHLVLRKTDPKNFWFCVRNKKVDNDMSYFSFVKVSYERKVTILERYK